VNVGGQGKMVARTHIGKLLQAAFQPRTAEGTERSAGGLVKRGLKINVDVKALANFYQLLCHAVEQFAAFDHARAGYKERLHAKVHNGLLQKYEKLRGKPFVLGEKAF